MTFKPVGRWQRDTFPAIARAARAGRAEIYFLDESGFRADAVHGRTWAARGQTPVVITPGQRQGVSTASAVTSRGAFWFVTFQGTLTGERFVEFFRRLMRHRPRPLHLVLDSLPAHTSPVVRKYVDGLRGKLTLHNLPGYAPDLKTPTSGSGATQSAPARHASPCKKANRANRSHRRRTSRAQAQPQAEPIVLPATTSVAHITD